MGAAWWLGIAGVRVFGVLWGGLLVVASARAVSAPLAVVTALMLGVVVVASVSQPRYVACGAAVTAWLVVTGFAVNDGGELRVTGVGDGVRLAVILAAALATTAGRDRRHRPGSHLDAFLTATRQAEPLERHTL